MPNRKKKSSGRVGQGAMQATASKVPRSIPAANQPSRSRTSFRMRMVGDETHVTLCDIVTPFASFRSYMDTATVALPFDLSDLNPLGAEFSQFLPKLHGFAQIYSRFRVLSARLIYSPLCPTSNPGRMAMAIIPGSFKNSRTLEECASFEQAAVGPAYMAMATPAWKPREVRWFNVSHTAAAGNTNADYPFTINLVCDGLTDTSNVGQAGLFWLEVSVAFCDLRPMPSNNLLLKAATQTIGYGSGLLSDVIIDWSEQLGGGGLWGWASALARKAIVAGTTTPLPFGSFFDTEPDEEYIASTHLQLAAVSGPEDEKMQVDDEYHFAEKPKTVSLPVSQVVRSTVLCSFRSCAEAREAFRRNPHLLKQREPNTAGNLTVALYCQPQIGDLQVIKSVAFVPGTGAVAVDVVHDFKETEPCTMFWGLAPATAGEHRVIDPLQSTMTVTKVIPDVVTY